MAILPLRNPSINRKIPFNSPSQGGRELEGGGTLIFTLFADQRRISKTGFPSSNSTLHPGLLLFPKEVELIRFVPDIGLQSMGNVARSIASTDTYYVQGKLEK